MDIIARRFLVAGTVQGVGFRNYMQKKAQILGVKGWVKNLSDGRVEAFAVGTDYLVGEFERFLNRGPMLAEVKFLEKEDVSEVPEIPKEEKFRIIYE